MKLDFTHSQKELNYLVMDETWVVNVGAVSSMYQLSTREVPRGVW